MIEVTRRVRVAASPRAFFTAITDYDRYPYYTPILQHVERLSSAPGEQLVRFHGRFIRNFSYVLRLYPEPFQRLSWEQVEGPFLSVEGEWRLLSASDGASEWRYRNATAPGFLVPSFAVQFILNSGLEGMLERIQGAAVEIEEKLRA
jgi:ribosome-associated toxin RatA of RatAB toxin-antitoxin module